MSKRGITVRTVSSGNPARIERALRELFGLDEPSSNESDAVREAESAVLDVLKRRCSMELGPREPALRRLQHELVEAYGLESRSVGREPYRRLVVRPGRRPR